MFRFRSHKYGAVRCEADDGRKFASKKERKRYLELKDLKRSGEVLHFITQTPWQLNDSGTLKYISDFLVWWSDFTQSVEDVKGYRTDSYKMKKKLFEEKYYPIKITEI